MRTEHITSNTLAAPRFALSENVARKSSMSASEAEAVCAEIADGSAPEHAVYTLAFKVVAYAADLAGSFDTDAIVHMTMEEAQQELDRIAGARAYLRTLENLFSHYPVVTTAFENLLRVMFYAEATLIPFYLTLNRDVAETRKAGGSGVQTYIVKHPVTGLLKIGRSANAEGRIKSLETGAGAPLSTLALIPGDVEQELHQRFAALRRHGEWFEDVDGAISAYAASVGGRD